MRATRSLFVLSLAVLLTIVLGCQPADTAVVAEAPFLTTSDGTVLELDTGCLSRSAFGQLDENVPAGGVLVSPPILFRWYYYPVEGLGVDWSTACFPTSFTLHLSPGPEYTEDIAIEVVDPQVEIEPGKLFIIARVTPPALQPHTVYRWMVVGHAGRVTIDEDQLPLMRSYEAYHARDQASPLMGGMFTTGPECAQDTIQTVELLQPASESVIETSEPLFQWSMPGCTSQAFWLQVSTDPDFEEGLGGPHEPAGGVEPVYLGWVTKTPEFLMYPDKLQPCGTYFWRVSAGLYSWEYHIQLGNWSTVSDPAWFTIAGQGCEAEQATLTPALASVCRAGTSRAFNAVDYLEAGVAVPVLAVNPGRTWAFVRTPGERECWVWLENASVEGDLSRVATLPDPQEPAGSPAVQPGPTAPAGSSVNCASFKDPQSCAAAGCKWVPPSLGQGEYCTTNP